MPKPRSTRCSWRLLAALLALLANYAGAGAPLLHAVAHWTHHGEEHRQEAGALPAAGGEHRLTAAGRGAMDHAEIHTEALHDELLGTQRLAGLWLALPARAPAVVLPGAVFVPAFAASPSWNSRGPPPGGLARAPPLG